MTSWVGYFTSNDICHSTKQMRPDLSGGSRKTSRDTQKRESRMFLSIHYLTPTSEANIHSTSQEIQHLL
jgi:hypothetical protein